MGAISDNATLVEQHDALGERSVVLTAPSGDTLAVPVTATVVSMPLGEVASPNGTWTLHVVDSAQGNVGELYGWALEVVSL